MLTSFIKVLKFGGTSVGSAEALERLAGIVKGEIASGQPVLVVSALSGVTDLLVRLESESRSKKIASLLRKLVTRHLRLAGETLDYEARSRYLGVLADKIEDLRDICRQSESEGRSQGILASGELISAPLVAALLRQNDISARAVDARSFIKMVRSGSPSWVVDRNQTQTLTQSWYVNFPKGVVPVVTGFIGSDNSGQTVTLGRGGSDYSASLIAEAIGASKFDRWTDVDGLFTADPNKIKEAGKFLYLLLEDAATWNEGNQLGMHAEAFEPVLRACIPVHVRSTRYPQGDGTLIMPAQLPSRVKKDAREKLTQAARLGVLGLDAARSAAGGAS